MNKLSVSLTQKETIGSWVYLLLYMFLFPSILAWGNMLLPKPLEEAQLNFVYFLVNLLCVAVIGRRFFKASWSVAVKNPFRTLRVTAIGFLLYYCATWLLGLLTVAIRPDFVNVNDSSIISMSREHYLLMGIGTVLLVPPVEEFLYRGLVFGQLYKRSRIGAYAVSTAVFCAIHVIGYIGSYDLGLLGLCFLQYVPAGMLLAWVYVKADTIWAPILMHITINQIGMQTMR